MNPRRGHPIGSVAALAPVAANARHAPPSAAPFAWLAPGPAGPEWTTARLPSGAALARPPGWERVHADSGAAAFAVTDGNRSIAAYLNATPRQGAESLANW